MTASDPHEASLQTWYRMKCWVCKAKLAAWQPRSVLLPVVCKKCQAEISVGHFMTGDY